MEVKSDLRVDAYLEHFGVMGMKWGVRKRDPKPVSTEKQAKRNKKASKYEKEAADLQKKINVVSKQKATNYFSRTSKERTLKDLGKAKTTALESAARKKAGKLTKRERNLLIGGSVVAGLIAAGAIHKGIESGDIRRLTEKAKNALTDGEIDWKKKPDLAAPDLSVEDIQAKVMKDINPDYGKIGTKMNCRRATMAYEMRRRGYDVMATRTTEGNGQTAAGLLNVITPTGKTRGMSDYSVATRMLRENQKMMEGRKDTPTLNLIRRFGAGARNGVIPPGGEQSPAVMAKSIFDHLAKEPNRSRGELGVEWAMGGGHSVAYEIINGSPVIFDNQSGAVYNSAAEMVSKGLKIKSAGWTRLDNVPMNEDFLLKWLKNV